jgi:outer membrane protein OmpA-like peptidoglycan-associated protein
MCTNGSALRAAARPTAGTGLARNPAHPVTFGLRHAAAVTLTVPRTRAMQERSRWAASPFDLPIRDDSFRRDRFVPIASLVALVLIVTLGTAREAPLIEDDIRERTTAALESAQIAWARFEVDGRDVTVLGEAPSAAARNTAYRLVAQLEGVRLVRIRTSLRPYAPPVAETTAAPTVPWSLFLVTDGAELTLRGTVPDAQTEALLDRARRRFTVASVHDELSRDGGGAPPTWVDAAGAALDALVLLELGEARLAGSTIEVTGVSADAGLRARTRQALLRATPPGFTSVSSITLAAKPGGTRADCQAQIDAVLRSAGIEFDRGSADLRADSVPVVDELIEIARLCPSLRFEIAGHTDDRGDARANLTLSQNRAEEVMEHLVRGGVALSRLTARGYGEARPIATGTTPEARARNRRIEIHVEPAG